MAGNKVRIVITLIAIILATCIPSSLYAQVTVTIRPNNGTTWDVGIFSQANITEPGASFTTPQQSSNNTYYIRVQNSIAGRNWQIYVQRNVGTWNAAMKLYVQRVTNDVNVWGGQPYVYIPYVGEAYAPNPNTFFGGTTDINFIYVQLQVDLPMAQLYVGSFNTTITYTIIDNL